MVEKFIISLRKKSEKKLDKLIIDNCPPNLSLSRTKIQDLIKRNMIFDPKKLNILTLKTKTDDLEQIIIYLDDTHQKNLLPENLDVPIVFEDDSLAVLNKPSNMVVHPVKSSQSGTLVNFLIFKYQDTLPIIYDKFRPGIVHRLDKDTTGLIVIAKTQSCAESLIAQFKNRQVKKFYLALCIGNPLEKLNQIISKPGVKILKNNSIEVRTYIRRNRANREIMEVNNQTGKLALSRFSIQTVYYLGENQKLSLIGCEIETGRTHQIRVHAKFIGCPIFGDDLYKSRIKQELNVEKTVLSFCNVQRFRQMLHSHELSITHPESGKRLFFRGDFPPDFSNILLKLDKYKTG